MNGRRLFAVCAVAALLSTVSSGHAAGGRVSGDCTFDGMRLYGKVQIVEHFPDLKIQIVEHFPDIKVQIVEHFPDIKVKYVQHFPGMP